MHLFEQKFEPIVIPLDSYSNPSGMPGTQEGSGLRRHAKIHQTAMTKDKLRSGRKGLSLMHSLFLCDPLAT